MSEECMFILILTTTIIFVLSAIVAFNKMINNELITQTEIIKSNEKQKVKKRCGNCKNSDITYDGFTISIYCKRIIPSRRVYVSGDDVCDKWKSDKPKGSYWVV